MNWRGLHWDATFLSACFSFWIKHLPHDFSSVTGPGGLAGGSGASGISRGAERPAWGVSALLLAVSDALAARFAGVTVRGEVVNFTRAASGHCYFTLKDSEGTGAGLRCAMFRRAAQALDRLPRDGQQVLVQGRLAVYEARGELQLVVERLQPLGAGQLYEEFLRLQARLAAEGLFDAGRKRPLPAVPRRLAVVTSAAGAALHDVLSSLHRRAPHVQAVLVPSLVQGAEAPLALVAAMGQANRLADVDLIVLCRGGGSLEDLWAFNDERVVRAVVASRLPVVCGVGHETDVTLADLAADLRAPTPTAAAELATPAQASLLESVADREAQLRRAMARRIEQAQLRLDQVSLRWRAPQQRLMQEQSRGQNQANRMARALQLALLARQGRAQQQAGRLQAGVNRWLAQAQAALERQAGALAAMDPQRVLQRGYAWVADAEGRPVLSVAGLQAGDRLQTMFADGRADVTVDGVLRHPPG